MPAIGGPGDDIIDNRDGSIRGTQLVGNGGNDIIYGSGRSEEIWGDSEFPQFWPPVGIAGFDQINGGAGFDLICDVSGDPFVEQIYGGGGDDEFAFYSWYSGAAVDIIMDFTVRNPRAPDRPYDSLDVEYLLGYADPYWDRLAEESGDPIHSYDPWANGFLRFGQIGADTLLQFDIDGAAGPLGWQSVVLMKNVDASLFTGRSFSSYHLTRPPLDDYSEPWFYDFNYTPAVVLLAQEGGEGDDSVTGYKGVDIIHGLGGDDSIDGGDGDDLIEGGEGEDTLRGGGGADGLDGGGGNDILVGGAGADVLTGGLGDDMLRGGGGPDRFLFAAGDGDDIIADYANGDVIAFADDIFGVAAEAASLAALKALADDAGLGVQLVGGNVVIALDADDSLTLKGAAAGWLLIA